MYKESQPNPTAPVPTEVPAFPLYVKLLNGPLLAAGQSSYSGMNIHDLMCLHKIHLCIYKIYKHIKHNKHFRDCFVPSQTLSLRIQLMCQHRNKVKRTPETILMPDMLPVYVTTWCHANYQRL